MAKTVLVTGAGTGIGRYTVSYLATRGLSVFAGLYPDAFEGVDPDAAIFSEPGVHCLALDITDPEAITRAVARIEELAGKLNGLVNNAGVSLPGPLEIVSSEQWRQQLEVNIIGTMATTRACLPLLRRGRGRIVNLGSAQGRLALPYSGPYCASKAAIAALTDALRMELAPAGLRVSLIEPGFIESKMIWKSLAAWDRVAETVATAELAPYTRAIAEARALANRLGHLGSSPRVVAVAIYDALCAAHPRARYRPGRGAWLQSYIAARLPPALLDVAIRAMFARLGR